MLWHPWRHLGTLGDVDLQWKDTERVGCFNFRSRTIELATGMTQAERRCALTHELIHVERGPVARHLREQEERLVERLAARRLIPIEALGEAMAWTPHMDLVAEEVWVDLHMLWARLDSLRLDERQYLDRRLYGL